MYRYQAIVVCLLVFENHPAVVVVLFQVASDVTSRRICFVMGPNSAGCTSEYAKWLGFGPKRSKSPKKLLPVGDMVSIMTTLVKQANGHQSYRCKHDKVQEMALKRTENGAAARVHV
jgi:hypothetical protein